MVLQAERTWMDGVVLVMGRCLAVLSYSGTVLQFLEPARVFVP
jgi:hypothetical protein